MALYGALAPDDGAPNPLNPDAIEDGKKPSEPRPDDRDPQPGQRINLLDDPDETRVAKRILELWTEQDPYYRRQLAQTRANRLRREGHINVQVVKSQDYDRWEEWSWGPPVPHSNQASRLCRKVASHIYADPPAPHVLPASNEPVDTDGAEFAELLLADVLGDNGLNDSARGRKAFDLACTYGSVYRHLRVNPRARREPLQVEAAAGAVHVSAPFKIPAPPDPMTGQPPIDPTTGQPAMMDAPPPYQLRYVAEDGSLTDERAKAMIQWLPALEDELLPAPRVRFIPAMVEDLDRAAAVMLAGFKSISELKRMFPKKFKEMPEDQLGAMTRYRPDRIDDFIPGRGKMERDSFESMQGDNRMVFCILKYCRFGEDYPEGAYLYIAGGQVVLHRQPWAATAEDGSREPLDPPIAAMHQLDEGREGPHRAALMEIVGPGNEQRAGLLATWFEYLDRFNRRKVFVPTNSIIDADDLENPTRTYLPINPGGEPTSEQVGEFPKMGVDLYDRAGADMNHDSGLEEAAQGLEDPSVRSAKHASTIVTQVQAGLSEMRQNAERFHVRSWTIVLQLVRAFFTKPQRMTWASEDGRFLEKRWSRADLGSTKDVRLKPASMSMMTPTVKLQYITEVAPLLGLAAEEIRDLLGSGLAATIGWKEDPARMRIRRQIAEWEDGPPAGWMPVPPLPPTVTGVDPMGQPQMGPPQLQDPVLLGIWQPVPADDLPPIAQVRLNELAKCMSSVTYLRWPPEWRMAVELEFQRAQGTVQAAMAPPPMEGAPQGQGAPA
jgi:hypothetical protein